MNRREAGVDVVVVPGYEPGVERGEGPVVRKADFVLQLQPVKSVFDILEQDKLALSRPLKVPGLRQRLGGEFVQEIRPDPAVGELFELPAAYPAKFSTQRGPSGRSVGLMDAIRSSPSRPFRLRGNTYAFCRRRTAPVRRACM